MRQYIDKSAVVTEIEKIEYETNYEPFTDEVLGKRRVCKSIKSFLDSLEVKEVDLEKEFDKCCEDYIFDDEWDVYIARHFFKLGFQKAQKGE